MKVAVKEALRVVISMMLVIMLVEMLIMIALGQWSGLSPLTSSIIDTIMLATFIAPALYLLVFRPLKREISERRDAETGLREALQSQRKLNQDLCTAQDQLLESEKLASMGLIAAGVAHEINNPVGFVGSNLGSLESYAGDIVQLLSIYESCHDLIQRDTERYEKVMRARKEADIDYLTTDISNLIQESREGVDRVKRIVKDLKDFSRTDDGVREYTDLNHELERTLNIVHNELKYHTKLDKHLGQLPRVSCVPSQINQVFLNILVNAGQAIEKEGVVTVRTEARGDEVCISIADTGSGMTDEQLVRLFEPFYTTKPRGKGTGLGLSVSWGIINKHGGRIEVESEKGKGTCFHIYLPQEMAGEIDTKNQTIQPESS